LNTKNSFQRQNVEVIKVINCSCGYLLAELQMF